MKTMNKKKIIGSIVVLAIVFVVVAKISSKKPLVVAEKPQLPQSVSVQAASDSKVLATEVQYPAIIVGDQEVQITAKSAGTITVDQYGIGDKVNAGTLLARVDDTGSISQSGDAGFQSVQVQQSQLSQDQAQESLSLAKKNYKDLKSAYDDQKSNSAMPQTVSKAQVDSANKQIDIAELQLSSANVGANNVLDNHLITSPIAGVVINKAVSVGDSVSVGQLIATISKSSNMKIQFYVDQDQLSSLLVGQQISAQDGAGNNLQMKITNIAAAADPVTRRFLVEAAPQNVQGQLFSGTILTVTIKNSISPQNSANFILPLSDINVGQNESYIFVADNNVAKKVDVTVANVNGESAEISANISPDALIITDGSKLVQDGETIAIKQ